MKKTARNTLIGVGLLAGSLTAFGQESDSGKMYVNVNVGGAFLTDVELNGGPDAEFDIGFRFDAAFGYHLSGPWALEFETGWVWNSVDKIGGSSPGVDVDVYQIP